MMSPCTADTIQIHRREMPQGSRALRQEVTQDCYVLSAPMGWGHTKIVEGSRILHDGEVRPGMLRLMSPGESVTLTGSVMKGAYAVVPGPLFRKLAAPPQQDELREPLRIKTLSKPDQRIHRLFIMLLSAENIERRHHALMVSGLTQAVIAIFLEDHYRPAQRRPSRDKGLSEAEFRRCVDYARSMISKDLVLEQWAQLLDMSIAEFDRRFQICTGQAPYAWYLNMRIARAKELLLDPSISLVEIAFTLGFCSQSHFHETFRRRVGVTPGSWRRQAFNETGM